MGPDLRKFRKKPFFEGEKSLDIWVGVSDLGPHTQSKNNSSTPPPGPQTPPESAFNKTPALDYIGKIKEYTHCTPNMSKMSIVYTNFFSPSLHVCAPKFLNQLFRVSNS